MQPELEQNAVFGAARRKFRSKFLSILGKWRESLTYSNSLVKHSDHRSLRNFLNLDDSVATPEVRSMFDMVFRRKREGEHQEGGQAKVDILRVSSNGYLYYLD